MPDRDVQRVHATGARHGGPVLLMRRATIRRLLAGMDGVMAVNAGAGAWYAIGGAPNVPREWLDGTPFTDYRIPGAVLGSVVGSSQAAAAVALAADRDAAKPLATAAGGILLGWISTQLAMIGYRSPLQPAVLCWALVTLVLSRRL